MLDSKWRGLSLADRFNLKFIPEPNSGCWLWVGKVRDGYGRILYCGKMEGAHRVSWRLHRGEIPSGILVCHKCDVPLCVNPDHMFLGTASDNAADKSRKGRAPVTQVKLNAKLALKIRSDPRSYEKIAASYGVHKITVHDIKKHRTWRHLQ